MSLTTPNLATPAEPVEPVVDRYIRQRDLIPADKLATCHALVIGVGAGGRQVALQLAAIGAPRIVLYDDDVVAVENLACQGYGPNDLGLSKVAATATACLKANPEVTVECHFGRFKRSSVEDVTYMTTGDRLIVFCCVDSIATRKIIWETLRQHASLFIDGRMSAEVIRILAVDQPLLDDHYESTLFASGEAYAGACTAKSTIYTANIAAGLMVSQFTKWLRAFPVDADLNLNLLSMEMSVGGGNG